MLVPTHSDLMGLLGHAVAVLEEFVDDLDAAYPPGEEREALQEDWPDVLVAYEHAKECLELVNRRFPKSERRTG